MASLSEDPIDNIWETIYFHDSQENSIESLWKNLQDLYERDTTVNKLFLMNRLFNLKMKKMLLNLKMKKEDP